MYIHLGQFFSTLLCCCVCDNNDLSNAQVAHIKFIPHICTQPQFMNNFLKQVYA